MVVGDVVGLEVGLAVEAAVGAAVGLALGAAVDVTVAPRTLHSEAYCLMVPAAQMPFAYPATHRQSNVSSGTLRTLDVDSTHFAPCLQG